MTQPISRFLAVILLFILVMPKGYASNVKEYVVKSVLSVNFARFTQWPEHAFADDQADLLFCVIGENGIDKIFRKIENKKVGKRHIQVKSITKINAELSDCRILFVTKTDRTKLPRIFSAIQGHPVLVIGEMTDFAKFGGMINFVKVAGRTKFEINPKTAKNVGLKLSARLLKLAIIVE